MGTNKHYSGEGGDELAFSRPVNHILLSVSFGVVCLSFDGGRNYIDFNQGFYSFPINPINKLVIAGSGDWQIVAETM